MKRALISTMCFLWLGLAQAVAQEGQIDWDRAQQIHQKFLRRDRLTVEEQAYHDRAAKALRAKSGQKSDDGIDWEKAQRIHEKFERGDKLTDEEQGYHDRAAKALQSKNKPQQFGPVIKPPAGLRPLSDMTAEDRYKGEDGGLYGGGKNEPPKKHLQAALAQAKLIRPLDGDGKPDDNGKIVLISVGMSNTTQEFSTFVRLANADPAKSSKVVIVDGAQGGQTANVWANPGSLSPWDVLDQRLKRAGVTAQQVQVAWIKQAIPAPEYLGAFPKHAEVLKGHMVGLLDQLRKRFPNVRIAYLSSRIYAGYARTHLNPEPYAYESAFLVRWLIQDQIKGEEHLPKSPLLLWGPYLWADGEKGRKSDDLVWKPEDLGPDGTHPSPSGQRKVAELLLKFMKTDPTAKGWFMGSEDGRSLDLSDTRTTDADVKRLEGLDRLQCLYLSGTHITDAGLDCLKNSKELKELDLNGTQITDAGVERLRSLKQLECLYLSGTKITDAGLQHLKVLSRLQRLELSGTKVTDHGLKCLEGRRELEHLALEDTRITDAGLNDLKECNGLRSLELNRTQVTDKGVKELKKALPNCTIFREPVPVLIRRAPIRGFVH